jgi:uncharacterized membrane protein YqaE (UPF0057 family)
MKNILFKFLFINILIILASCSTTNEVSQNSSIQKRKYRSGYYISFWNKNKKHHKESIKNIDFEKVVNDSISLNEDLTTYASLDNEFSSSIIIPDQRIEHNAKKGTFSNIKLTKSENSESKPLKNIFETKKIKHIKNKEFNYNNYNIKYNSKSQKLINVNDEQLLFLLLLILAFILPPLSVLLFTNIDWKKVIIATLLTCLFWGPGVLYAILVLLEIL